MVMLSLINVMFENYVVLIIVMLWIRFSVRTCGQRHGMSFRSKLNAPKQRLNQNRWLNLSQGGLSANIHEFVWNSFFERRSDYVIQTRGIFGKKKGAREFHREEKVKLLFVCYNRWTNNNALYMECYLWFSSIWVIY